MKRCNLRFLFAFVPVAIACSMAGAQILPKNRPIVEDVTPITPAAPIAPVVTTAPVVTATPAVPAVTVAPRPGVAVVEPPVAQNIQATRAADLGLWFSGMANNGLTIADLANNSIFTNAGFRVSDQIISINGQPIRTEAQFVETLTSPVVGTQPVQILIVRNGQQHALTLSPSAINQGIVTHDPLYQYGLAIDDSNPNQIIVQRVYPRTPAYYAGLRPGDVITTFGGQRVTSLNAFTQGLSQANVAIPMQITRSGQTRDLQLAPIATVGSSVRTALRPNIEAGAASTTVIEPRVQTTVTPLPAAVPGSTVITTPSSALPPALPSISTTPASPVITTPVPAPPVVTSTPPAVVVPAIPAAPLVVPTPVTPR